jgi:hypothetical protein
MVVLGGGVEIFSSRLSSSAPRAGPISSTSSGSERMTVSGVIRSVPIWYLSWYRIGMSKQIAVRLPEDLVEFVDQLVGEGRGASRASVVAGALERERRRLVAARDIEILTSVGDDPDMNSLAEHVAGMSLGIG